MNTGEDEQGLRRILDMTRLISIILLSLHFYYYCYQSFVDWGFTTKISDQILKNLLKTGLFDHFQRTKWISLGFLIISLMGARGKKTEGLKLKTAWTCISIGGLLYFASYFLLFVSANIQMISILYIVVTSAGYLLFLTGGTLLSRVIKIKLNNKDIFNIEN